MKAYFIFRIIWAILDLIGLRINGYIYPTAQYAHSFFLFWTSIFKLITSKSWNFDIFFITGIRAVLWQYFMCLSIDTLIVYLLIN